MDDFDILAFPTHHHRLHLPGKWEEVVTLLKEPVNGSHFGTCTCRAAQTNAVPCEHMSVIALSAVIRPQISPLNIMPIWWKRSQRRLQFPLETCPDANITMKSVKEGWLPDYGLRLCPDWTTGRKAGRPKMGERIKSGLETAMAKGKAGTNRKAEMWCVWCIRTCVRRLFSIGEEWGNWACRDTCSSDWRHCHGRRWKGGTALVNSSR